MGVPGDNPARQRDIFPLPFLKEDGSVRSVGLSRSVRRRILRKNHWVSWANDGVLALNQLSGVGARPAAGVAHSEGSKLCLSRIAEAYAGIGTKPDDLTSEGALRALLGCSGSYGERQDLAPYASDLVSWAPSGQIPVNLADVLPEPDRERLVSWKSRLLRDSTEAEVLRKESGVSRPYCDPSLTRDPKKYGDFLKRLEASNMIRYEKWDGSAASLGIFFVKKKNGTLRLIFDTRLLNTSFKDPSSVVLPSAAAMSSLEVSEDGELYISSGDVMNAFYGLRLPDELASMMTLPAIRARHAGISQLNQEQIDENCWLVPCLQVLPMGWSWSLKFCQALVEDVVSKVVKPENLVKDKTPGIVLKEPSSVAGAAYVDNYGVFGLSKKLVNEYRLQISSNLKAIGLSVHEEEGASTSDEFVGLELQNNRISIKVKRI